MGSLDLVSQGKDKWLKVGPAVGTQECLMWCHSPPPQNRCIETYKSHLKTHLYLLWKRTKNRGVSSFPMDGGAWKAAVHEVAVGQTRMSDFTLTFHFRALEKEMATHSSVLA